jgi:hypothetical protein
VPGVFGGGGGCRQRDRAGGVGGLDQARRHVTSGMGRQGDMEAHRYDNIYLHTGCSRPLDTYYPSIHTHIYIYTYIYIPTLHTTYPYLPASIYTPIQQQHSREWKGNPIQFIFCRPDRIRGGGGHRGGWMVGVVVVWCGRKGEKAKKRTNLPKSPYSPGRGHIWVAHFVWENGPTHGPPPTKPVPPQSLSDHRTFVCQIVAQVGSVVLCGR